MDLCGVWPNQRPHYSHALIGAMQGEGGHPARGAGGDPQVPSVVVGLALKKEKRKKHISDKLVALAAEAGIALKFIDKELPLEQQGPFVAILQKVRKPGEGGRLAWLALRRAGTVAVNRPPCTAGALPLGVLGLSGSHWRSCWRMCRGCGAWGVICCPLFAVLMLLYHAVRMHCNAPATDTHLFGGSPGRFSSCLPIPCTTLNPSVGDLHAAVARHVWPAGASSRPHPQCTHPRRQQNKSHDSPVTSTPARARAVMSFHLCTYPRPPSARPPARPPVQTGSASLWSTLPATPRRRCTTCPLPPTRCATGAP